MLDEKENPLSRKEILSYFFLAPFYFMKGNSTPIIVLLYKNKNRNGILLLLVLGLVFWFLFGVLIIGLIRFFNK